METKIATRISSVIVPLDGSKAAEQAIPVALALAEVCEARLEIVHVVPGDQITGQERCAEMAARRQIFAAHVAEMAAARNFPQGRWRAEVKFGNPAKAILDEAAEGSAIVIASHGRSGAYAAVIGSVADKVVRGSAVPVLVVPRFTALIQAESSTTRS